jgi:predicted neuraminidase
MEHEICDDSESIHTVKEAAGWPNMLCEGSFFQTEDGTIHMLLRSSALQLWVTRSRDDGTTWSPPEPTGFTDNNTKFHFGMLPDGTYYYVGSPDPLPKGHRNPLVLSLSDDGAAFRRHFILKDDQRSKQFPGMYKNGQYGYPHSLVHDGYLYVIYSVCKEQIEILRVPIETI